MTLLLVLVAVAVVGAVAVLMIRDRPLLQDDPSASPQLQWDPEAADLAAALDGVRFTIALRGYRMDQVDRVLDDLARALEEQQDRIAELEGSGGTSRVRDDDDPTEPAREGPDAAVPEAVPPQAWAARVAADPQESTGP